MQKLGRGNGSHPVDIHVGGQIRARRKMLEMSQAQLGENLGLTFQQIQKYEKGTNRISASKLYVIAKILNAPVPWFFLGLDPIEPPTVDPFTDPRNVELIRLFVSFPPEVRGSVLGILQQMADVLGDKE
jgi:transcriptional regulator with XRE-family HTH domain